MSDDMGDDDRVVVLGRGPVDGRDAGVSRRGVLLCPAEEGRTPESEERDCKNRETLVSVGLSLPEGFLISKVVRVKASF